MHCFTVLSTIYDARNRNDDDDAAIRSHPASRSRSQNSSVSNVTKILEASARIQLDIVDLYYHMASVGKIKVMLKDVNLQIKSGEMCAIMGPTGAGKSTLLELIAGRKLTGSWCGEVLLNKKHRPEWFAQISAYVCADDILLPTLTIKETLLYAACTRMEGTSRLTERTQRVNYLIDLFGLVNEQNNFVGRKGAPGALTDGQRKKVAIMVEIIAIPRVVFMDDPTSSLDTMSAMETMTAMRRVTDSSRICLTTIQNPSSDLFALFDRLILLSAGRVIYSGPIDKVVTYFESIGYPYVSSQIAGDYIIQICGDKHKSPNEFQALFHASKYYAESIGGESRNNSTDVMSAPIDSPGSGHSQSVTKEHTKQNQAQSTHNPLFNGRKRYFSSNLTAETASLGMSELMQIKQPVKASRLRQAGMLFHRAFVHNYRDTAAIKDEMIKSIGFALLIGTTFYRNAGIKAPYMLNNAENMYTDEPTSELVSFTGIFFYIFMFMWFNNSLSIHSLTEWNALYRREAASDAYKTLPYLTSSLYVKLPFRLISFTIFVVILYPMCRFPHAAKFFVLFYAILFLTGIMCFYMSQTCVTWTGSENISYAIIPHLFMFFGLFSGYPVLLNNIPPGWSWASYVSFLRWSFGSLLVNQFGDNGTTFQDDDSLGLGDAAVINFYGVEHYRRGVTFLILLLCYGVLSMVTYYGMTRVTSVLFHLHSHDHILDSGTSTRGHSEQSKTTKSDRETFQLELGGSNSQSNPNSSMHSNKDSGANMSNFHLGTSFSRHSEDTGRSNSFLVHQHHSASAAVQALRLSISRMSNGTFGGPKDILIEDPDRYFALDLDDFRSSNIDAENTRGIKIDIVDMSYNHVSPDASRIDNLSNISGSIPSGAMVAIMGGVDCGKHTLLDVIAGRRVVGAVSGQLLFNGMERSDDVNRSTSYVTQSDIHLSMLTVRETLQFAAEMRMDANESTLNKEIRVNKVLDMISMKEHAGQLVGDGGPVARGLNGGQRRRLSIGVEIINFPALIFLDCPTTNLDSITSDAVITAVRNLANQNRTAICTLDHPTAKSFNQFDLLVLLSRGQVIFFGPVSKAVHFFHKSPYEFNYAPFINPAEFVLAISDLCIRSKSDTVIQTNELVEYFQSKQNEIYLTQSSFSSDHISSLTVSDTMMQLGDVPMQVYKSTNYQQLITLMHRYRLRTFRTKGILIISALRCVLAGFVLGSVFNNSLVGASYGAYNNRFTFCFMSLFFNVLVQMQTIPIYFEDLAQFEKEKQAKLFMPAIYWLSIWILHCGVLISLHTLLFAIVAYSISGFCVNAGQFIVYVIVLYLASVCGYLYSQLCSMVNHSVERAIRMYTITLLVTTLFSGYFQYIPDMQSYLTDWAPALSFMRWAYQALVTNELDFDNKLTNSQYYVNKLGFDSVTSGGSVGLLILFTLAYMAVLLVVVRWKTTHD